MFLKDEPCDLHQPLAFPPRVKFVDERALGVTGRPQPAGEAGKVPGKADGREHGDREDRRHDRFDEEFREERAREQAPLRGLPVRVKEALQVLQCGRERWRVRLQLLSDCPARKHQKRLLLSALRTHVHTIENRFPMENAVRPRECPERVHTAVRDCEHDGLQRKNSGGEGRRGRVPARVVRTSWVSLAGCSRTQSSNPLFCSNCLQRKHARRQRGCRYLLQSR